LRKLQREVFVLSLRDPQRELPILEGFEVVHGGDGEIEVAVDAERDLNELFELLNRKGIRIASLRNKANRLEELFLALVEDQQSSRAATA
jgi:ABC-2 type transport system ATP-binding protein